MDDSIADLYARLRELQSAPVDSRAHHEISEVQAAIRERQRREAALMRKHFDKGRVIPLGGLEGFLGQVRERLARANIQAANEDHMDKTHRDQEDIPTEIQARRDLLYWVMDHPVFHQPGPQGGYPAWDSCVDVSPVYVDPQTRRVNADDDAANTLFQVWIEAGPLLDMSKEDGWRPTPEGGWNEDNKWSGQHDLRLDCGGDTLELAILHLATLVKVFYTDTGEDKGLWWCPWHDDQATCTDAGDGFCEKCGFRIQDEDAG